MFIDSSSTDGETDTDAMDTDGIMLIELYSKPPDGTIPWNNAGVGIPI